jgi:iron complex transport system substrate-binding protein
LNFSALCAQDISCIPDVFAMRIVSLLPGATEILYAIGAGDCVVGVTHECDFPPEAAYKPALIRPRVDATASQGDIDRQVREIVSRGESLYVVEAERLLSLHPNLIVTQDLCHVCAASPEDLAAVLARLPATAVPQVLTFSPHRLADVAQSIRQIGLAAGRANEAQALAKRFEQSVHAVARAVGASAQRPRVLCLEWFDPPYVAGHWLPEMVRLAGGRNVLGREGLPSFAVEWRQILDAQPDVIVLMPCGYGLEQNLEAWRSTPLPAGWTGLPAVRSGNVFAVDANAYLSRPGPRLADGLLLLAKLIHPRSASIDLPPGIIGAVRSLVASAGSPR